MAFTSAEKIKIRLYLGYPQNFRQQNPRLEGALDQFGTDSDIVTLVQGILANLVTIEGRLLTALSSAGIKSADEVSFFERKRITEVRDEGRRFCAQLSLIFGLPLAGDAFGESGYGGDSWGSSGFQVGGKMIPQG